MTKEEKKALEQKVVEIVIKERGSVLDDAIEFDEGSTYFGVKGEEFEFPFRASQQLEGCCGILEIRGWDSKPWSPLNKLVFPLFLEYLSGGYGLVVSTTNHLQTEVIQNLRDNGFVESPAHNPNSKNNISLWSKVLNAPIKIVQPKKVVPAKKAAAKKVAKKATTRKKG